MQNLNLFKNFRPDIDKESKNYTLILTAGYSSDAIITDIGKELTKSRQRAGKEPTNMYKKEPYIIAMYDSLITDCFKN